jgi:Domain of unknown function (DUF4190)
MSGPYGQQPQQWQQPHYGPDGYVRPVAPWQPKTSGTATASLVFGIIGLCGGFLILAIPNIIAVILGHMANKEIRESHGWIGGQGLATAGLVLGYIVVVPAGVFLVLAMIGALSS